MINKNELKIYASSLALAGALITGIAFVNIGAAREPVVKPDYVAVLEETSMTAKGEIVDIDNGYGFKLPKGYEPYWVDRSNMVPDFLEIGEETDDYVVFKIPDGFSMENCVGVYHTYLDMIFEKYNDILGGNSNYLKELSLEKYAGRDFYFLPRDYKLYCFWQEQDTNLNYYETVRGTYYEIDPEKVGNYIGVASNEFAKLQKIDLIEKNIEEDYYGKEASKNR